MSDDFSNITIDTSADISFSNDWAVPSASDSVTTDDGSVIGGVNSLDVGGSNLFSGVSETPFKADTSVGVPINIDAPFSDVIPANSGGNPQRLDMGLDPILSGTPSVIADPTLSFDTSGGIDIPVGAPKTDVIPTNSGGTEQGLDLGLNNPIINDTPIAIEIPVGAPLSEAIPGQSGGTEEGLDLGLNSPILSGTPSLVADSTLSFDTSGGIDIPVGARISEVIPTATLSDQATADAIANGALPNDFAAGGGLTTQQQSNALAQGITGDQLGLTTAELARLPAADLTLGATDIANIQNSADPTAAANATVQEWSAAGGAPAGAKLLTADQIASAVANGAKPSDFANLTGKEGLAAINAGVDPVQLGAAIVSNGPNGVVNADGTLKVSLDGRPEANMKDPNLQSSLTIQGNLSVGVGVRRPEVGINWGYAMMDVSQAGGAVGKMLTGQKLGANDEVTLRSQFELDAVNIPGLKQLVSNPVMKKILGSNLDQMDAGIVGKLTFGFKDNAPYLKKLEGFAYADLPSVGGIVTVDPTTRKVSGGNGGNQGFTNLTAGVQWTNDGSPAGKWEVTNDATNGKLKSYFRPENAQQYNTPYVSGWAVMGINSQGQERLATPLAQRVIDAARSGGGGNAAVEKITKVLDRTTDVAQVGQFIQNMSKSLDTTEKSGRTDVGLGVVQAIVGAPPLPPGAGVAIRAEGKVIASQDGKDDITLKVGNNVVAQTTATTLRKKGEEFSNAITRAFTGESESSAPTTQSTSKPLSATLVPADNTNGGVAETAGRVYDIQVHAGTDPFALVNKDGKNHGNAPVAVATAVTQTLQQYGAVGTPKNATDASRMITETALALRDRGREADANAMIQKIVQTTGKYGVNFGNSVLAIENEKYAGPKPDQETQADVQKVFRGDFKPQQQIRRT
jgi:hypothetical protein